MICRICNKMFKTDKTLIIHYKNIHSDLYNSLLDKNIRVLDYNNKLNDTIDRFDDISMINVK